MAKNPGNDIGAVIALSIGKNRFGYGRIADNIAMQVFDLVTIGIMPASSVLEYPVAFWSSFLSAGFKNGRWKKIGHVPFKKRADSFAPPFGIDNSHIQAGHYLISHKRRLLPATAKDIAGLEREFFRDADDMATEIRRRVKRKPIRVTDAEATRASQRDASRRPKGEVDDMRDWGSGPFEYDDAADFLDSLESTRDRCALIRRTLRRAAISRSYLELPESASAWVAAELVAALRGAGLAAAKKRIVADQLCLTRTERKELTELAAAALARIARDSELLDLLTEAGQTTGFKRRLNDLRRRLSQPSNVKQHRAAASKSRGPGRRPGPGRQDCLG